MTRFGRNMKWTSDRRHRERIRALFVEVLGATHTVPGTPDLDLYRLGDGFNVGVYSVDASEALRPEDARRAPWLEFAVDDVEETSAKLVELGFDSIDYADKAHRYFQAPGGPVFRLASSTSAS